MTERLLNNKSHPELRGGEVFITNISNEPGPCISIGWPGDSRSDWKHIGWKTKRMGSVAYDIYGKPVNGMRPVFAKKTELEKAGVNTDSMS